MKTIQEIKTDFEQVLNDLQKNEINPEKSVDVALILIQESGKDRRAEIYNTKNNGFNRSYNKNFGNGNEPATDKQKYKLKINGIKFSDNITKAQASALIDELMQKTSNGSNGMGRVITAPPY